MIRGVFHPALWFKIRRCCYTISRCTASSPTFLPKEPTGYADHRHQIRHVEQAGKLKALVSVTFDGILAVHDIKIIDGRDRLFLAMPSRRMPDGRFRDIAHPVGHTLRDELEQQVLDAYRASFLQ